MCANMSQSLTKKCKHSDNGKHWKKYMYWKKEIYVGNPDFSRISFKNVKFHMNITKISRDILHNVLYFDLLLDYCQTEKVDFEPE